MPVGYRLINPSLLLFFISFSLSLFFPDDPSPSCWRMLFFGCVAPNGQFRGNGSALSILKTYIGDVLLSVNPYKPLAQYTELTIASYKRRSLLGPPLPPHV